MKRVQIKLCDDFHLLKLNITKFAKLDFHEFPDLVENRKKNMRAKYFKEKKRKDYITVKVARADDMDIVDSDSDS